MASNDRPTDGEPLTVTAWYGAPEGRTSPVLDPACGIALSTEREDAARHGPELTEWTVRLRRAHVVTQAEAEEFAETDRGNLVERGYDGRVVLYDDGSMDVVAFDLDRCERVAGKRGYVASEVA